MKLKVGDIEMDSQSGISFGEQPAPAVDKEASPPDEPDRKETSLMARLPDWPRRVYALAGVLALAAIFGFGQVYAALSDITSVWRLTPLVPIPGLLAASAVAFWRGATGAKRAEGPPADHSDRLIEHLAGRLEPASVEELVDELDWREQEVVRGLKAATERDLVVEDLDLDTGHWTYTTSPRGDEKTPRRALPIDERAKRLEDD
ncbi:MAG: hypothetical protein ACOCV2_14060 [Persicimonas sp.]